MRLSHDKIKARSEAIENSEKTSKINSNLEIKIQPETSTSNSAPKPSDTKEQYNNVEDNYIRFSDEADDEYVSFDDLYDELENDEIKEDDLVKKIGITNNNYIRDDIENIELKYNEVVEDEDTDDDSLSFDEIYEEHSTNDDYKFEFDEDFNNKSSLSGGIGGKVEKRAAMMIPDDDDTEDRKNQFAKQIVKDLYLEENASKSGGLLENIFTFSMIFAFVLMPFVILQAFIPNFLTNIVTSGFSWVLIPYSIVMIVLAIRVAAFFGSTLWDKISRIWKK